jgi:heme exporter protein B
LRALETTMSLFSNTAVLLGKELRTEFRSRELLTTTAVFILVVLIMFSFAINPTAEESRAFGPGLLWLAILFAASLMLQPCFLREQNNDTLSSLRLAVSDPFAIFLAKLAANTLFLLVTELLMLPLFAVFYNIPVLPQFRYLLLVLLLGSLGVSVAGTALSAISAQARMRELLLPLLLLPILTPILVVSAIVTVKLLDRDPVVEWKGIGFLALFDVVFLTALWLFGEYLLEE